MRHIIILLLAVLFGCTLTGCHEKYKPVYTAYDPAYSFTKPESNRQLSGDLAQLATTDEYDVMLAAMKQGISDLERLGKAYNKGDMPQTEFQEHLRNIVEMYEPVRSALSTAQATGALTLSEQKQAAKILGKFMGRAESLFELCNAKLFN